ncbi:MAG: hypothetical protein KBS86_03815 [Proteobacteria bacterium]|nr:hypothetical protein [Candidatus Enterousia scatequi]
MNKVFISLLCCLCFFSAVADDCVSYKLKPNVTVSQPDWEKDVVQPLKPMDLLHGDVIATMVDNYDITADITSIEDGFCVGIKNVDAVIGYSNFLVQIDIRHIPNTCSYNVILSHEDQHIRSYLSVIDDLQEEIKSSILSAADSVMPVFIQNESELDNAINTLNEQLQNHPDMILIKQKIKAAEEIKNRAVDQNTTDDELKRCFL